MSESAKNTIEGYLDQQMLIAMPGMADPNFARSVTLLCQHSGEGAIGITINRESGFTMGEILEQLNLDCEDPEIRNRPVLEGGPVAGERGFVLHTPMEGFESSILINADIMITTSRDVLAAIASGAGPERFIMALGYAGWGDGQLESELRQNAWLSVAADSAIIFDLPLKERWARAVSALGIDIRNLHDLGGHA
ncbi:MAG: YqgE/AlgH family protein [Xanthomonadales bacterium]|nr:YqgE/AlgH family protein [Xanthomonadales bacterium]